MASIRSYPNGAGGTTGADLATVSPLLASGVIWYVGNAVTGASDSNAGTERTKPLATIGQAYANVVASGSATDIIDVLAGHSETITTTVTLARAGLTVVGEGSGSTKPRFTNGTTASIMFDITAAGVLLDNLTFPASIAAAVGGTMVRTTAAGISLNALTVQCGAYDTAQAISCAASTSQLRIANSTFTSTAATPASAIANGSAMADLTLDTVTFDGGSFGWSAAAWLTTATITRIRATNISLLNGSDITLATANTGVINVIATSGSSQVNWVP